MTVGAASDPCQDSFRLDTVALRRVLEARLLREFPVEAQLDEGHARLSSLSMQQLDCEELHVAVSGEYEFRANLGVMDVTRRGTLLLGLQLMPRPEQQQILLEQPRVQELTFGNPAPWFDGKAITNWVLALFATPVCAELPSGLPC